MSTSKKKLTFEEKLNEYLNEMQNNDNNIIQQRSKKKFSDGSNLYIFFYNNKKEILDAITNEKIYLEKYPIYCENIKNNFYKKVLTFKEKLEEYLKIMEVNNYKILERTCNYLFSDDTKVDCFWNNHRKKIYDEIFNGEKSKYYQDRYSKCCESIKKYF